MNSKSLHYLFIFDVGIYDICFIICIHNIFRARYINLNDVKRDFASIDTNGDGMISRQRIIEILKLSLKLIFLNLLTMFFKVYFNHILRFLC